MTHTNDLTALALTHSALHELVIPPIYSRFDIVWPDASNSNDTRTGVDALTYGLSTLVMSRDVFGNAQPKWQHGVNLACPNCGHFDKPRANDQSNDRKRRRKGNNYAQYTRKFSLGNGPPEWVQEYLISKESGKMLGTLVALAVARMTNLESFIWDMPTGIVRDVWDALSSLSDREDGKPSKLESIWIRCHDSKHTIASADQDDSQIPHSQSLGSRRNPGKSRGFLDPSYRRIEHPNLSILSPLKSITVLEIDELAYLEELSVLLEKSINCLRELRIGSAKMWHAKDWPAGSTEASDTDIDSIQGYANADGMLGIAMRRLYNYKRKTRPVVEVIAESLTPPKQPITDLNHNKANVDSLVGITDDHEKPPGGAGVYQLPHPSPVPSPVPDAAEATNQGGCPVTVCTGPIYCSGPADVPQLTEVGMFNSVNRATTILGPRENIISESTQSLNSEHVSIHSSGRYASSCAQHSDRRKTLRLQVLELERISLGIDVLKKTIDWTSLTSLTLLNCELDENLWKALRRVYSPRPNFSASSPSRTNPPPLEYNLNLKRIRTNNVSPSLIAFLKETLAPNTLECMILQDNYSLGSKVTIETIFRGPLRRHRASLRKIMIDSGDNRSQGSRRSSCWKKWTFTREVINFVTSGKMASLRELALAIDYKDWVLMHCCSCGLNCLANI